MRKKGFMVLTALAALAVVGTWATASKHGGAQPQAAAQSVAAAVAAAGFDDALAPQWQAGGPAVGDGSAGL